MNLTTTARRAAITLAPAAALVALAAPALAATGSGDLGGAGTCGATYHFQTLTHSVREWMTGQTCTSPPLKHRAGVYCVYPGNIHAWVQGNFVNGNGSSTSNYSAANCNTNGQGSPVNVDIVYQDHNTGAYITIRVYTG